MAPCAICGSVAAGYKCWGKWYCATCAHNITHSHVLDVESGEIACPVVDGNTHEQCTCPRCTPNFYRHQPRGSR